MITDERIVSYIHSLEKQNSPILEEMESFAHQDNVPIIRKEMESFIRVLLGVIKPAAILELGTAIGYSAILMSECIDKESKIITIENYEKRIPIARENIKKAGKESQIQLIEGDALEVIKGMEGKFDFIFMDAAKAQYINYLPEVLRLLSDRGVLLTDNVLQEGDIIESRYVVRRRDRTIHARMREYLSALKNLSDYETSIVPIGDGVSLTTKKL